MKREILFRGFTKDGQWVHGTYHYSIGGKHYILIRESLKGLEFMKCLHQNEVFEVEPDSVGQLSGVKDKNQKDIYEGDIVRCGYGEGQVVFYHGCFMVEWSGDSESMMELLSMKDYKFGRIRKGEDEFEVIGNSFNIKS